ncbi:hypothetical protein [Thiofilum flexile]|nr:hypothetical protein [Thiofilum flexile]
MINRYWKTAISALAVWILSSHAAMATTVVMPGSAGQSLESLLL